MSPPGRREPLQRYIALCSFVSTMLRPPKWPMQAGQGPAMSIAGIGLSFQGPRGGSGAVPRGAFSRRLPLPCQKQFLEKETSCPYSVRSPKSPGHTSSNPAKYALSVQRFPADDPAFDPIGVGSGSSRCQRTAPPTSPRRLPPERSASPTPGARDPSRPRPSSPSSRAPRPSASSGLAHARPAVMKGRTARERRPRPWGA